MFFYFLVYDIINIMESLNVISREGKNFYKWRGFNKILETIANVIFIS